MHANEAPAPPESPPATEQPTSLPPPSKRFRKRTYAILGIVAVAAVASALVFAYLVPQGSGTIIPLSYNFTVGDSMTYNMTTNMTMAGQNSVTIMTISIYIVSFDGENYTMNGNVTFPLLGPSASYSETETMIKKGYATFTSSLTGGTSQTYPIGYGPLGFGPLFLKDQAGVGEAWQVPVSLGDSSLALAGNLTFSLGDVQNVTVQAGTYRVFRLDVSGSNLTMSRIESGSLFSMNVSISGQEYFEYGTCRPIDFSLQENAFYQSGSLNSTASSSMQITLVQDIKH